VKNWKTRIVPLLFALGGVLSLIGAVVKPVMKGEPLNKWALAIARYFFVMAVVFLAVGRKSGAGSDRGSA
jgi:hypothetical protein